MIKAIIFDMDGVIINSEPLHDESTDIILKNSGIIVSEKDMPLEVASIKFLPESNELYLSGKENYLLSLNTKLINRTDTVTNAETDHNIFEVIRPFSARIEEFNLPDGYEFVLQ